LSHVDVKSDCACRPPQVGNQAFAFAFQQLLDLSYLWTTSTHTNVTNATLASGAVPADEVRLLNDTRTVVSGRGLCTPVCSWHFIVHQNFHKLASCPADRLGSRGMG
jgi:hypothetical protein